MLIPKKKFQTTIHRFTKIGLCLNDRRHNPPFRAAGSTNSDLRRSWNLFLRFYLTEFNSKTIKILTPAWTLHPELWGEPHRESPDPALLIPLLCSTCRSIVTTSSTRPELRRTTWYFTTPRCRCYLAPGIDPTWVTTPELGIESSDLWPNSQARNEFSATRKFILLVFPEADPGPPSIYQLEFGPWKPSLPSTELNSCKSNKKLKPDR